MSKKQKRISLLVFALVIAALLIGVFLTGNSGSKGESIQELMQNEVLHETNKISLFGLIDVNPGLISAFLVTAVLFVFALIVRIFVIPRFRNVPGKFQTVLEEAVGLFDRLAKSNSPHRNRFLGAYVFTAGTYIFVGTLFELFGFQAVTTQGISTALTAPLSDINGAIALGFLSYGVILVGGITANGLRGLGRTLKEFSLPISMSFRLFGALLSGALVTGLVYYYISLSFVLPVIVGVLFTLLHAVIQAYVLTMLTALFYGEVTEIKHNPKTSKRRRRPGGRRLDCKCHRRYETMKIMTKKLLLILAAVLLLAAAAFPAYAADENPAAANDEAAAQDTAETAEDATSAKAWGAAIAVGLAAAAGAIGMGIVVGKSSEGISRQPEAEGKIRSTMMLGLVFIETVVIYALIVAILLIFVL